MPLLLGPRTLASYLKEWIELIGPYSLLYGVDASGLALLEGDWCARRAVTLALADMI